MVSFSEQNKPRLLHLDGIRAVAALYVLLHHASLQFYGFSDNHLTGFRKIFIKLFSYGHMSVDIFIVLSGYSLMLAVIKNGHQLKEGILGFYKRRIIRIVPAYYAAILISLVFIAFFIGNNTGTLWDMTLPVSTTDVITHFLMVHDIFSPHGYHMNYAWWSISVEFRIYLLFPLLLVLWRNFGGVATLVWSFIFSIAGTLLILYLTRYMPNINIESSGVVPYIIMFTLGMFAADVAYTPGKLSAKIKGFYKGKSLRSIVVSLVVYIIIFQIASMLFKTDGAFSYKRYFVAQEIKDVMVGIFAAFFLFICAIANKTTLLTQRVIKVLSWKPLVAIGTFSYSLYLIHPPLLQIVSQYFIAGLHLSQFGATCVLMLCTPLVIFISWLFFLLFERPFLIRVQSKRIPDVEIAAAVSPAP